MGRREREEREREKKRAREGAMKWRKNVKANGAAHRLYCYCYGVSSTSV